MALLLLLLQAVAALGQAETNGTTPSGMAPGAPAGSYALSGFDNVNLFNGHLNFRLPLLSVGGRGGAGYRMTLPVEQTWTVWKQRNEITGAVTYHPEGNWWTGIKPGYGPGVLQGRKSGAGSISCGQNQVPKYSNALTRLTFTAGDGTEYELRDHLTGGQPKPPLSCSAGFNRGRVFVSADGSSATFVSDSDVIDAAQVSEAPITPAMTGYLLLRDGTRYRFDGGTVTWLRDRNGNKLTFAYDAYKRVTSITDPLGRQITVAYAAQTPGSDVITYKGFGAVDRTISVNYDYMQNALRPDQALQTPKQLFPDTNGSSTTDYNPTIIKSVTLPNDGTNVKRYQFFYNSYGELARVVLPTGGAVEYDYMAGLTDGAASGSFGGGPNGKHVYRRVVERRLYPEGGSGAAYASKTTYSRPETTSTNAGYVVADQCAPSGTTGQCGDAPSLLSRQRHYFHGSAGSSFFGLPTSYPAWDEGKEYQTEAYAADGTTLLRRVVNTFAQRAAVSWWAGDPNLAPANDPRLTETVTTLADTNQVTKQVFGYSNDLHNNQTDVWEYDYGAGAAPAYATRHTHTDYLVVNPVNGLNYADPANGSTYVAADIHVRSLPRARQVYAVNPSTGAETLTAQSETRYDEYPLFTYGTVAGWEEPGAARGLATTVRRWLDTNDSWLENRTEYDQVGNVRKIWDARSVRPESERVTQISYTDSFSDLNNSRNTYAYPTATTSAVPAPSPGPHAGRGSDTPLTTSSIYDYSTGLVRSTTDANNKVTSYEYNDALDRPTKVNRPDGGWTSYWYDRNAYGEYVGTCSAISNSQQTEGYQFFDGLGRGVRSFQYDGSSWITSDTEYDALGRAWRVSAEPYLSAGSGSPVNPSERWVESTFDALGRATHVKTTADGAQVTTAYSGNAVTVTDQAGKQRKSVSDALGRMTQIVEAPGVGTCQPDGAGCATDYTYDALGNLRKVDQGGQLRYFMYDSLGRLVRAKNPEQAGALPADVAFPALTDPLTGNAQWSLGYTYDENGNLSKRRDARGVTTTYTYDNLNRPVRTDYSDGTPFKLLTYDLAENGRGRFHADYESSTEGTSNYVTAYDEAGRPTAGKTEFYVPGPGWLPPYTYSRAYDLAGNVTAQTYPSKHTVSYHYDVAGRLADSGTNAAFSGDLGDGTARAYASAVSYDGAGRMRQERFGTTTPLYHKRHFNARGQLFDARLSTVEWQPSGAGEWDWNRGLVANWYGNLNTSHGGSSPDNNGNVVRAHSSVPLNDQISEYSYHEQRYTYDTLNRLSTFIEMAGSHAATPGPHAAQSYSYDRWGNRQVDAAGTWLGHPSASPEPDINETQFGMEEAAASNRLLAPGDAGLAETQRRMRYDAAGNLTKDTYTGSGDRTYDAENRMTSAWGHSATLGGPFQNRYVYDAAGKRVRRKVDTGEVWQVYGFEGELLAEYAAGGAPTQPRKEYGYRAGELLVVAESGGQAAVTHLSDLNWTYSHNDHYSTTKDLSVVGTAITLNGVTYPKGLGVHAAAEVRYQLGGNYSAFISDIGLDDMATAHGSATFEVWADGVKLYDSGVMTPSTPTKGVNVSVAGKQDLKLVVTQAGDGPTWDVADWAGARLTAGGGGYSSSAASSFSPSQNPSGEWAYGYRPSGGQFTSLSAPSTYFGAGTQTWALPGQPCCPMVTKNTTGSTHSYPAAPNVVQPADTLNLHPGPSGERSVVRWTAPQAGTYTFAGRFQGIDTFGTTTDVRIEHNGAPVFSGQVGGYGAQAPFNLPLTVAAGDRVEFSVGYGSNGNYNCDSTGLAVAVTGPGAASQPAVRWLVSDHLGTPRITAGLSGDLDGIRRHDYLPFGEEVGANIGGRTMEQGYSQADNVRQKFTGYERDNETGLDFAQARYYSNTQGRFASVDQAGPDFGNPQTLNKYQYCLNNPLRYKDRSGLYEEDVHRDLTRVLAYAAGFSMDAATAIGNRNQHVDDNPTTNPVQFDVAGPGFEARRDYHFTTEERRKELWESFESQAFITTQLSFPEGRKFWGNKYNYNDALQSALDALGTYMHAQQDSYSHQGYGPRLGHLLAGHAPDKTYNNVPKANTMALDTYNRLAQASSSLGNFSRVGFDPFIASRVHTFNETRSNRMKNIQLRLITIYVTMRRKMADQPLETTSTTVGNQLSR